MNQTTQHWYSTGSGSDLVPRKATSLSSPGRYRSLYCTAARANIVWFDLVKTEEAL